MTKIHDIESQVGTAELKGEIARYHAISAALTTVKYDLLTLYVTIRSGGLTATKTSFLYPILSDTQRWLTYAYHQIKTILASFPGSRESRRSNRRAAVVSTKTCVPSLYVMSGKLKKAIERSQTKFEANV